MAEAPLRSPLRALLPDAAAFLRRRLRVIAVLAGWSLLEAAQTFLTGYALARALDDGFLAGRQGVGLGWLGATAAAVVAGAFGTGRVYRAVCALVEPLRDGLVRRVVSRGLWDAVGAVHRSDTAVVSRLTHQVEIARDTFAGLVMVLRSFVFTAAGALAGLVSLDPALLLVVLPPLLSGIALFALTLRPMARRQDAFLAADEAIAEDLGAVAAGLRDVAACGAEERVGAQVGGRIDAEFRAARALARWGVLRVVALAVGGRLPILLLLATAPWLMSHGMTAGALVGALAYLTQSLLPALQTLMHGLGTTGTRLAVVLDRLACGAAPAGEPPPVRPAEPRRAGGGVELRGVTFGYTEQAAPVIRDLDLVVPEGGHLAVVGPSGIGKSTLAGLVAGLLEPRSGEVRVCGEPVTGRAAADLSRLRVLIPQEAYVFSGSVRDNLGYLCPDPVPDAGLRAAIDAVGLGPLVAGLGGLDAQARPAALSAGERQLIALARAYLSPAPVVLLDEATCHLDPAAEARAERAFARRPGTLVVVAHRISSAARAERVLVMDGSRAVVGRHGELLDRSPLYRDLAGRWYQGARWDQDAAPPSGAPQGRAARR